MAELLHKSGNSADERDVLHHRLGELPLGWGMEPLAQVLRKGVTKGDASTAAELPTSSGELVLDVRRSDASNEAEWLSYNWQPKRDDKSRRPRGVGIATFARQLMAVERTRMRRRTPPGSEGRQGRKTPRLGVER